MFRNIFVYLDLFELAIFILYGYAYRLDFFFVKRKEKEKRLFFENIFQIV